MIPERIMHRAIEGGFDYRGGEITLWEQTALRPDFWQALGKALVWGLKWPPNEQDWLDECKANAHRFYDLILTGGDTEKFWRELSRDEKLDDIALDEINPRG